MVSEEKRALRAFIAVQALQGLSAIIIMIAQYIFYLPPAMLTPFAFVSTLLFPGFALTWAMEGASIWKRGKIRIVVWSILLSLGLNFLLLLLLNLFVGIFVWQVLMLEQLCVLSFSAIGYKREGRISKALTQEERQLCPNCGEPVRPTDIFCTNCGSSLRDKNSRDNAT